MGVNFPYLVVRFAFTRELISLEKRTGTYYFAKTAIKEKLNSLFLKSTYPVRLKDSQLLYLYKDPLPELMFVLGKIVKSWKKFFQFAGHQIVRTVYRQR